MREIDWVMALSALLLAAALAASPAGATRVALPSLDLEPFADLTWPEILDGLGCSTANPDACLQPSRQRQPETDGHP